MRRVLALAGVLAVVLLAGARQDEKGGGTVKGAVKHPSVAKFPAVVYIEDMPGTEFKPPAQNPIVDQKGKVFIPRILPVLAGTTVDFLNSDDFEHNVFSPDGETYNLGNWGKGDKRSYTFKRPGVYVQLCKVHPEMVAYVVVLKTPYYGVAGEDGKFRIPNVPAGIWKLKVWNERLKPKQLQASWEVKVEEAKDSEIEIKP